MVEVVFPSSPLIGNNANFLEKFTSALPSSRLFEKYYLLWRDGLVIRWFSFRHSHNLDRRFKVCLVSLVLRVGSWNTRKHALWKKQLIRYLIRERIQVWITLLIFVTRIRYWMHVELQENRLIGGAIWIHIFCLFCSTAICSLKCFLWSWCSNNTCVEIYFN